jgi:hypothetical protein
MAVYKKGKARSVTGSVGSKGCGMSRLPRCLDNRLTDGGGVTLPYAPAALYSFLLVAGQTPGP